MLQANPRPENSSQSVNRVLLIGRLTRGAEIRRTSTGTALVTFGLATNEGKQPEFHDIVAWREMAEIAAPLRKGTLVQIEGSLHGQNWKTRDGQNRRSIQIVAQTLRVLGNSRF